LFVTDPSGGQRARARLAAALPPLVLVAWLGPPLALALAAAFGLSVPARLRAALRIALPALVVLYAAALRFEALVARYSWEGPRWALAAERAVRPLHPAALRWKPALEGYSGDPYSYLVRAREMEGFYEPSVREPLFPFVTRQMLHVLGDRNVAVNAASALFSTLVVLATYLLGAQAFSRAVGLAAALGVALHRDAIWFGVEGFRDDAFTLFVLASTLALLRLRERPTAGRAVLAGLAAAGAMLSRVTSVSFLLPALAVVAFAPGADAPRRRKAAALAVAVLIAVAGPYLLSCTLAYGDPFYAVNFHTKFYRSRSGMAFDTPMSALDYLRTGFRPFHLADTGLTGLTSYPFGNKWGGLEHVSPWIARLLAGAAVVGLGLFLGSAAGRLLLVVLVTSLLPYAFTWEVPGGAEWRFTMHALPFYLIAAGLTLARAGRLLRSEPWRALGRRVRERPRRLAAGVAAVAVAAAAGWAGLCALTYLRARESLRAGEPAVILAGPRDWLFFGSGWDAPRRRGFVTVRRASDLPASLWIPLGSPVDCRLTLRIDPDPPAAAGLSLDVGLNGAPLASLPLSWDPSRIGSYELLLPKGRMRAGRNRLDLGPGGLVLWYVRVEPAPAP
jgi:4-amino-4-deoxy-L-arabinose transferase-like glycosyltransferase